MRGIVDIHCHILPGVDDGAVTERMAVEMIRMEKEQGVNRIILTPHYRVGVFETEQEVITRRFKRLCEINKKTKTGMELYLGCEFHRASAMTDKLQQGIRPTMDGSRYVLVEFSHRDEYVRIRKTVYELIIKGWIPIIAHGERYPSLMGNLDRIEEVLRLGAKLQITAGAVYGQHGFRYKRICKKLMSEDLVHFIATDAHDLKNRAPDLGRCAEYIERKKGPVYTRRILVDNPGMILAERIKRYE